MQILFGKPVVVRNADIPGGPAASPSSPAPRPALKEGGQASSLFPHRPPTGASPASTPGKPQYRKADATAPSSAQDAVGKAEPKHALEAAVDNGDSKTISKILKLALGSKSVLPFKVLRDAIDEPNARRVEIMVNHPDFAAIFNEPEAEHALLGYAVREAAPEILGLLLAGKRSARHVAILCEATGPGGNTLLHMAAASGDRRKLELIMEFNPFLRHKGSSDSFFARLMQGDAINAKNADGKTALALALGAGHTVLADLLLERGARP